VTTIRDRLVAASADGTLLQTIADLNDEQLPDDALAREIADAHNAGLIDAVATFRRLKNLSGHDFWLTRHVFEKALPELTAPVLEVMTCCDALLKEGGNDGAAGMVLNEYANFLAKEPTRYEQALEEIEKTNNLHSLIVATLAAGSRTDPAGALAHALKMAQKSDSIIRGSAIAALARLEGISPVPAEAKAMLERVASSESEDTVRASAIRTVSHFACIDSQHEAWTELAARLIASGGDHTLHAAAEALSDADKLPKIFRDTLLARLPNLNPENRGTVATLDLALYGLVKNDPSAVVDFLQVMLVKHHATLSMGTFTHTASALRQNLSLVGTLLTRWFLDGHRALCEAVCELVAGYHGNAPRLEVDLTLIDVSDPTRIVFLARKTIGYLFLYPATVASVVVSLMATASSATAKDVGQLFFETMLINYSGDAQDALRREADACEEPIKTLLTEPLRQLEAYLANLPEGPVLDALQPSQAHREIQMRRQLGVIRAAADQAESQSALASIFKKSVMLYGRSSIHYIHGPGQERRRMQMPLQKHGVRMEVPRMSIVDPIGLERMRRTFRGERLKK
jgi:hypothetical protein